MNFLNGHLSIFSRVTTPCCRESVIAIKAYNVVDKVYRYPCNSICKYWPLNLCREKLRLTTAQNTWTQLRFNQNACLPPKFSCPTTRLHRDMEFPNYDAYRKEQFKDVWKTNWGTSDEKPGYAYVIGVFGLICGYYVTKAHLIHYVLFMAMPADVLAMATIEVDISRVIPGSVLSIKWRGKPLFIKSRTQQEIDFEAQTPVSSLRHPQSESDRVLRPAWLVIIGICTHLGCAPLPNTGDFMGGFYCPCHGAHYDNLGRTRKGPAPLNMEVPPYTFISDTVIRVGD